MDVYIIIFDIMLSSLVLVYVLYVLHVVVVVEFIVHIQPTCATCTDMEKNIDGRGNLARYTHTYTKSRTRGENHNPSLAV